MDDWAAGYVSDVEYGSGFYVAQAPEMANLVSLIRGYRPRDLQRGYTFCELGCGSGSTLSVLAAGDAPCRGVGERCRADEHKNHDLGAGVVVDAGDH